MANLSLVRHAIGRLIAQLPPGVDIENLEAAGTLGLVEAATNFDPSRGVEFAAFASIRIRGAVLDELRRNCPLPQHMLERVAKVRKAYEELPPPVSVEALAAATGLSQDETLDCLAAIPMTRPLPWHDSGEAASSLPDHRVERPDAEAERAEQKRVLKEAIESLPERERLTVILYYADDLRLKEIGQVLDLSEARVSRILSAALMRLRESLRARDI
jgi:RNA polymerase sigma factor for flagellar operon FliA